jgi:DNA repair exonuclease SbcCD ATPase subunit
MPKLRITELFLQNFRSFGDYPTVVNLDSLGPVLIIGKNEDDPNKSNGCGKTSLAEAIIWALFGRLPGNRQSQITPGDWVINEKTGCDCQVRLKTADGYSIERTRKMDNRNDLIIIDPTGNNISDSTNKNAQEHLYRLFDLDYDIFTSGIFFAQSSSAFMELPDQKRKKTLERILNLDKFDKYSIVAKSKIEISERQQIRHSTKLSSIDELILNLSKQIENNLNAREQYEKERSELIQTAAKKYLVLDNKYKLKAEQINNNIIKLQTEISQMTIYDITSIKKSWEIQQTKSNKLLERQKDIELLHNEITELVSKHSRLIAMDITELSSKITKQKELLKTAQTELSNLSNYDYPKLELAWHLYQSLLEEKHRAIELLKNQTAELEGKVNSAVERIKKWHKTTCPECLQNIPREYATKMSKKDMEPAKEQLVIIKKNRPIIKQMETELKNFNSPEITLETAAISNEKYSYKQKEIAIYESPLQDLQQQYNKAISENEDCKEKAEQLVQQIKQKQAVLREKQLRLQAEQKSLETNKPAITVNEAILANQYCNAKSKQITELQQVLENLINEKSQDKQQVDLEIENIKSRINPHMAIIDGLKQDLEKVRLNKQEFLQKVEDCDKLSKHLSYINKVYSDRKCIRAFVMSKLIPFFNERVSYYLTAFECDLDIKFNAFLQTESDKWPYELWSGGQKRRIDLAVMLAIHDLHENIYDKQCNILVFDEYDRSLDMAGIYSFVNLIFKDFADPNQTILVISHNQEMQDIFPSKIQIVMKNGFSYVEK